MPNPIEHNCKYLSNKKFIAIENLSYDYKEWYVTGVFYTVLHLIEEYLSIYQNKDSENHNDRLKDIKKDSVLKKILSEYKTIYHESIKARYYLKAFSDEDIEEINDCYTQIEDYIVPKLQSKLAKYN